MTPFPYRDGVLNVEGVPLPGLAEAVGTPFYCYSGGALEQAYRDLETALSGLDATICYALKANSNQALIRTFVNLGAGADVVSEGELRRALEAGVPARKIVFAGVGKSPVEMAAGLNAGILQFNVESLPEIEMLDRVARDLGRTAPIALRINPDVEALTHEKITTGRAENKFGIELAQVGAVAARIKDLSGVRLEGLAVHIGSQLTDLTPYKVAFDRLAGLFSKLRAAGFGLKRLDLGGGLGITYRTETPPDLAGYAAIVRQATAGLDAELVFEPGRFLVGNAGLLVTRVLYVKNGTDRRFVIVDAAMNDLIRPTLYDAWHDIVPVSETPAQTEFARVDVVGPICETSDIFARQRPLPPLKTGDLLAICSTGAYGAAMSSTYNTRPLTPEVLVRGDLHAVVRPRQSYAALIGQDRLPDWLERP